MSLIFAIDVGTHESGWVRYDGTVRESGVLANDDVLAMVKADQSDVLAIEGFLARGNVIDNNCVQTIRWEGRFLQAWGCPDDVMLVSRRDVKKTLGLPGSANDAAVNKRLRELIGDKGTKAQKGPTFGVTSHAWPALGVAYTVRKTLGE
ncbi:hypothetical protein ACFQZQ_03035 [Lysobacter koreensis]|uniref:RuvC-like resolvase n=1 Tax=Lysobacter koreensis TaxID=266122 RepID=A0ABW2YIS2_9GAMM